MNLEYRIFGLRMCHGYPLPRLKVRKVFERETLGLDFGFDLVDFGVQP